MSNSRTLCMTIAISLALVACGKQGKAPEPKSASDATEQWATASPMETSPEVAEVIEAAPQPTWEATPAPTPEEVAGMATAEMPVALTDEQIVGITETVNDGEIAQGKLAQKKAKNQRVKNFALNVVSQHSKAKRESQNLAKEAQLSVAESPLADDLKGKSSQQLEILKSAEAADFDRTYTEGQIEQHQAALELLTNHLIPNASNPELKAKLEKEREMLERHLVEVRAIQLNIIKATPTKSPEPPADSTQAPESSPGMTP